MRRLFLFVPRYFLLSYKMFFITKFVICVTKFLTHVTKFVICVTNFVTKIPKYIVKTFKGLGKTSCLKIGRRTGVRIVALLRTRIFRDIAWAIKVSRVEAFVIRRACRA